MTRRASLDTFRFVKRGMVVILGLAVITAVLAALGFVSVQVSGADDDPQRAAEELGVRFGRSRDALQVPVVNVPGTGVDVLISRACTYCGRAALSLSRLPRSIGD
jgi:hypothetical protein